ncbi:MAG: acetolactate synthase large subunit, partial [Bacteroidales bacterium]|nr:acetolactate synthase large subunit [Bacteroidales bacterium]
NKNVEVDVDVVADARQALKALLPIIKDNSHADWIASFDSYRDEEYRKVIEPKINGSHSGIIMDEIVHLVSEKTNGNAIVVTDVGQNQMVGARNYKFNKSNSWVTSGGLGTMGFGLPAAIGAKVASPDRQVIVFTGDGGFQMTMQELGTMAHSNIAVKIIIMNNSFLGMVRQWQDMFFEKRYSFTEITSPDFITVASAYGIEGCRVTKRAELSDALDRLLNSENSFLMEVMVEKEDNVFPMVTAGESVSNIRLE